MIPKNAKNKDGAWEFIKMAVDNKGGSELATKRRRPAHQQGRERDGSRIR